MDINDLRKMTLPKLRDLAKQSTDLEGVLGMKKEDLIQAIAKAQGISFVPLAKDVSTISTLKQEIRALKKERDEILATAYNRLAIKRVRRKIKLLKRRARKLAALAKTQPAQKGASEQAASATPA